MFYRLRLSAVGFFRRQTEVQDVRGSPRCATGLALGMSSHDSETLNPKRSGCLLSSNWLPKA